MIDALIRWSLRHRTIVVALASAFLVWGGWTAVRIPLDVLPDLTAPTVTILAEAPGMDPLEIESLAPFLAPVSSIMGEVLFVDLESDRHSPLELRTVAETIVRRRLLAVPGVSQVIATGGEQKQHEVVLDPARLAAHQVTLQEVEEALTTANQNATAGFQVAQGQEYLVRGVGRLGDVDAIAAVT